jgi:hypothetical protein
MKMKFAVTFFVCIGFVFAEETQHHDSCLSTIPQSIGLNIALDDSLSSVLRKIKLSKTKNAFGQTYWFSQLKIHEVPVYLQCFFENGKLIDIFITHKSDMPCNDSTDISKEIALVNRSLASCLNRSFDNYNQNDHDVTFDTVVSTFQIRYSYLHSTANRRKCGFSLEIENTLTNHYKIREEKVDEVIRNLKAGNKRF